ncbi:ABC transporter permease [Malaciobacter pacificus]|jgi:ABC-type lipoprotein release transport system permease subunit|uniref:ABC transporter, permease protein, FtsX/LolE family n=1 Tax=Malaciobacter pacificus TaxID=1080223 RepID=A0A5C2H7D7_9BACT|nr:FtsX-like permease family protein [Malaciobacter pacificus]QEP33395.1 ABC transporter, permease protein, FtsX/LolE family [Malaciobacter pacificus]
MKNSIFLNFLFLLLSKHKSKHLAIFFISIIIVFLISSVMFISNSLKKEIFTTLNSQADFVIQKLNAGKVVNLPTSWLDKFSSINGVTKVQQRVYGQYHFKFADVNFMIVGIDLFEKNTNKDLQKLLNHLDISSFFETDSMIIGNGVKQIFDKYHYKDEFVFRLENLETKRVKIFKDLPKEFNLIANDIIIMDINLAKEILNINEDEATDIVLNVPNELEHQNIKTELILKEANIRIIPKEDIKKAYENMFNYKGGFFLTLFISVMFTFILILYQRYSMINSSDKKEIGILKAVGWSIKDIIKLKMLENLTVGIFAFLIGVILAFIFVFILNAPLLSNIFLGFQNIQNDVDFIPNIDFTTITMLFLFFIIPFISAVLIPVWKISVIDASESMR